MKQEDWTKIYIGQVSRAELANIVREVKYLWRYLDNVWPSGDRKKLPQIKAAVDKSGQYSIWMNAQALTYLLLFCKDIPGALSTRPKEPGCPPELPECLRWDSKPE